MMVEAEIKANLRGWIRDRAKLAPSRELTDETPILDQGILSSLDVAELILYVESLRGEEVDIASIEPQMLRNVDTLYAALFPAA